MTTQEMPDRTAAGRGAPTARHSAWVTEHGTATFGLWAPAAARVDLVLDDRSIEMVGGDRGWWSIAAEAGHGTRYAYAVDGGDALPDPAARWLPEGVHAPGAVVDQARLADPRDRFQAAPITGAVIYELHVGTFTVEGTFDAATEHLGRLVDLGVTHVEVMPVNAFDGAHGWGYDGVAWWAVHQAYGGPEGFAAFIAACHGAGLGVILDVVHNHLGPSGNYLDRFGPYLQSDAESTWGRVINLDGPDSGGVREFIIGSALAWLSDYRVDALRLDAVHALDDRGSAQHLLAELSAAVDALGERTGRRLELIAETDRNDPQTIRPRALGGYGMDAQWADDLHHAIHVAVSGEVDGYYTDYADALEGIAHAYAHGLVHDGSRWSPFRGRVVGAPLPPDVSLRRLVACIQNHDQVGNRAAGDRLTTLVEADLVRVAIALLCAAPHTPMLFMGEEYGETAPFQFFSDMPGEDLRSAIREGRRAEFAYFTSWGGEVPDPLDHETFRRSTLDQDGASTPAGRARLALWTDLLALRRTEPALGTGDASLVHATHEGGVDDGAGVEGGGERTTGTLRITRRRPPGATQADDVMIVANLGDAPVEADLGRVLLSTADARYGGPGTGSEATVPPRSVVIATAPRTAR